MEKYLINKGQKRGKVADILTANGIKEQTLNSSKSFSNHLKLNFKNNNCRKKFIKNIEFKWENSSQKSIIANIPELDLDNVLLDPKIANDVVSFLDKTILCSFTLESNIDKTNHFYIHSENFKILEIIDIDIDSILKYRENLQINEWLELLFDSIGYDSTSLLFWEKIFILIRLIPYVEKSYHLMELGKRGVGKNYIHELFEDKVDIYTSTATNAKLFYNETLKKAGSLSEKDVVVFNEIHNYKSKVDEFITPMQSFMSGEIVNKGKNINLGCSTVWIGNLDNPIKNLESNKFLFETLTDTMKSPEFLDRFNFFIPNWGMRKMKNQLYSKNKKSIRLDALERTFEYLRIEEIKDGHIKYIENYLNNMNFSFTGRDTDSIIKTVSGLVKLLHLKTNNNFNNNLLNSYINIAIKGRNFINNQISLVSNEYKPRYLNSDNIEFLIRKIEDFNPYKVLSFSNDKIEYFNNNGDFFYYPLNSIYFNRDKGNKLQYYLNNNFNSNNMFYYIYDYDYLFKESKNVYNQTNQKYIDGLNLYNYINQPNFSCECGGEFFDNMSSIFKCNYCGKTIKHFDMKEKFIKNKTISDKNIYGF